MTEILYDETREGLMKLWTEAKINGLETLSDDVWQKIQEFEKRRTEEKLKVLREEIKVEIQKNSL